MDRHYPVGRNLFRKSVTPSTGATGNDDFQYRRFVWAAKLQRLMLQQVPVRTGYG